MNAERKQRGRVNVFFFFFFFTSCAPVKQGRFGAWAPGEDLYLGCSDSYVVLCAPIIVLLLFQLFLVSSSYQTPHTTKAEQGPMGPTFFFSSDSYLTTHITKLSLFTSCAPVKQGRFGAWAPGEVGVMSPVLTSIAAIPVTDAIT